MELGKPAVSVSNLHCPCWNYQEGDILFDIYKGDTEPTFGQEEREIDGIVAKDKLEVCVSVFITCLGSIKDDFCFSCISVQLDEMRCFDRGNDEGWVVALEDEGELFLLVTEIPETFVGLAWKTIKIVEEKALLGYKSVVSAAGCDYLLYCTDA